MRITRRSASLALIFAVSATASAQQRPAIRQIGATAAKSTEVLGGVQGIRALPDGRVLVNDVAKRRVLLFDPTLSTFAVIAIFVFAGNTFTKAPLLTIHSRICCFTP